MKVREGFVSNSSSSSFIIPIEKLTEEQLTAIITNDQTDQGELSDWDMWKIELKKDEIEGSSGMDNYDYEKFLSKIGIDKSIIKWERY